MDEMIFFDEVSGILGRSFMKGCQDSPYLYTFFNNMAALQIVLVGAKSPSASVAVLAAVLPITFKLL